MRFRGKKRGEIPPPEDELDKKAYEIVRHLKKDLTWQEDVTLKLKLHTNRIKKYGHAVKGHGGGWGLKDTAKELNESVGTLSQDIRLAKAIQSQSRGHNP